MLFKLLDALFPQSLVDAYTDKDDSVYKEEHERLENIIDKSENLWEERTYQIAAGGLSLSFAVFSFLCGTKEIRFEYHMALIWAIYAVYLIANYISHQVSISDARKMQEYLLKLRTARIPYDEESLSNTYSKHGRLGRILNILILFLLSANVIYTIVYTCIKLFSL